MKGFRRFILAVSVSLSMTAVPAPADSDGKEFLMSCTYGVMAGTLVGAALLAFKDQPGENLSTVARGASLGLYTGILLGFYVMYGVPNEEDPSMSQGPSGSWRVPGSQVPRFAFIPTLSPAGRADGAALAGEVFRF